MKKETGLKKRGKTEASKLQKICDQKLQLLNKKRHKKCEACGGENQVGHHWIEKSRSANLRYNYLENIIPLCNSCHSKIHNIFGNSVVGGLNVAEAIIAKRGREWKERMDREAQVIIKTDVWYYQNVLEHLEAELSTVQFVA